MAEEYNSDYHFEYSAFNFMNLYIDAGDKALFLNLDIYLAMQFYHLANLWWGNPGSFTVKSPAGKWQLIEHRFNDILNNSGKNIRNDKSVSGDVLITLAQVINGFKCHNKKSTPSRDETQRTGMFLFAAIAFAICHCYNKNEFYIYENGITSINLSKQMDVINARASRTTHPKTIELLRKLFRNFNPSFDIRVPYYNKTKADILHMFESCGEVSIITSSVSCSSTRNKPKTEAAYCGCCSQCIDRIFSMFATGLNEHDALYADDFIRNIPNNEVKQRLYNMLRLAQVDSDAVL